jgi:hypothetical protein
MVISYSLEEITAWLASMDPEFVGLVIANCENCIWMCKELKMKDEGTALQYFRDVLHLAHADYLRRRTGKKADM